MKDINNSIKFLVILSLLTMFIGMYLRPINRLNCRTNTASISSSSDTSYEDYKKENGTIASTERNRVYSILLALGLLFVVGLLEVFILGAYRYVDKIEIIDIIIVVLNSLALALLVYLLLVSNHIL